MLALALDPAIVPGAPHPHRRWVVSHSCGLTSYIGAGPGWVSVTDARGARPLVTLTGRIMQARDTAERYARTRPELVDAIETAIEVAWPSGYAAPEQWS